MARAPMSGPPPGLAGSNGTNHGPNHGSQCAREGHEDGCPPCAAHQIEHAEPLGSLGLNGAGDGPGDFMPIGGSLRSGSSSSSKVEYCGQCGGKHPTAQCVGVQGSCNVCGQYGHFERVCPLSGSQHTAAPPQGRGGSSRAGLKPRPAVKPGFPKNNTTRKTTKPQRDMGSNPSSESNYKTAVNSKNKMQMLCMRKETTAQRNLQQNMWSRLQEWYRKEELLDRSPTLPRTYQTTVGNDGNSPKKLTVNSTRVRRTEVDNQDNISLTGQPAGTREQIPPAGTRRNTQNGVAPTNQNATVLPSTNEIKQQLDTNMLPAFT
ncbi:hypothetical protein F511_06706 [Dorcoceras hygrometricum]|uniref:CCHC-type domain-containing protein n=1 Tax=Dorcoceras hygrometricum TaxID=472368 RepID=A0A2Z7B5R9_9LAMI|nr:hypothetical protein F511_06706 [Dorcoceras hygrometricum]